MLNPGYAPLSERLSVDCRVRALRLWPYLRNSFTVPLVEAKAALPARVQNLEREVVSLQGKLTQLRGEQQRRPIPAASKSEHGGDSVRIAELEKERRQLKVQSRTTLKKLEKLKEQRNTAKEHNADLSALQQHLNARLASFQGTQ